MKITSFVKILAQIVENFNNKNGPIHIPICKENRVIDIPVMLILLPILFVAHPYTHFCTKGTVPRELF